MILAHTVPAAVLAAPAAINQDIKALLPCEALDSAYLCHLLWSRNQELLRRVLTSTHGTCRLETDDLLNFEVPVPPIGEQRRIVNAIEAVLARVVAARIRLARARETLARFRASVLNAAVLGRLTEDWRAAHPDVEPADVLLRRILDERRQRWEDAERERYAKAGKTPPMDWRERYKEAELPEFSEPPELPEGWCWATSDSLLTFVTSGSRGWAAYYSDTGSVFLRIGNLDHDSIALDLHNIQRVAPPLGAEGVRTRVREGDILVSITADVGMVALAPPNIDESFINQHIALARPVDTIHRKYLAWYLASQSGGQRQFLEMQRGATKVGLGLDDIRSVVVPVPPLAEQVAITDRLEQLLSMADVISERVNLAAGQASAMVQSTLARAFRGELVPQDPADEPAAVMLDRLRAEANQDRAARSSRRRLED